MSDIPSSVKPIVRLKDVSIGYELANPLVTIPDLQIYPGEIVAIAGPSGVGKTTLLRTISGLLQPISGEVEVCEKIFPSKLNRGELGYIPQKLGLIRHASVWHNVMLGANAGHKSAWNIFPSSEARASAMSSISVMGLEEKTNEPIRRLSGGQQRRVATARTLAQCPKIIMADEFLSELDEETMQMVLSATIDYMRKNNSSMLVVEHDITRAKSFADRLLVIDDGRVNPFITETTAMEVKI
tara:strand:+ start:2044 stop:2766 length:723 start_codon:yes stop_codon:yes gene_type:complete